MIFYLYEISRTGKSRDRNRVEVAQGEEWEDMGSDYYWVQHLFLGKEII